jgi:hypothetical protein
MIWPTIRAPYSPLLSTSDTPDSVPSTQADMIVPWGAARPLIVAVPTKTWGAAPGENGKGVGAACGVGSEAELACGP